MSEKLLWSVKNGDIEVVKSEIKDLTKSGGNINNQIGESGRNALHFAADYGQTGVMQCLLEAGADVNQADKHGISPLLAAIWENHIDAVKLLLSKGANKNGKSPDGQSYEECAETDDMKILLK